MPWAILISLLQMGTGKTQVWGAEGRRGGAQDEGWRGLVLSETQPSYSAAPSGNGSPKFLVMSGGTENRRSGGHGERVLSQAISSPLLVR